MVFVKEFCKCVAALFEEVGVDEFWCFLKKVGKRNGWFGAFRISRIAWLEGPL